MRILEVISCGDVNGPVVQCAGLSRELSRRGHSVTVLCRPGAEIGRLLADAPIEVIESEMERWPLTEVRRVAALAREREIQIIHTYMTRSDVFGMLMRTVSGIPWVPAACAEHLQPYWMLADHVIAVSEYTRRFQQGRNLVRSSRIDTVLNCVDTDLFAGVPASARSEIRSAIGVPDSAPLLGVIGSIVEHKGHIHLIRALPQVLAAHPETRLAIVGTPRKRYDVCVKDEARRLGVDHALHWVPYRPDIPEVLSALDICVIPSLREAFGLAGLEAMAAGLPCVATRVGGITEWARDGETALLVRPADPDSLARAICRLLGDAPLRARLSEAARRMAIEQFSVERMVRQTEDVFQKVIDRSSARLVRSAKA